MQMLILITKICSFNPGTMGFESKPGFPEMYQGSVYRFSPDLQATACIEKARKPH